MNVLLAIAEGLAEELRRRLPPGYSVRVLTVAESAVAKYHKNPRLSKMIQRFSNRRQPADMDVMVFHGDDYAFSLEVLDGSVKLRVRRDAADFPLYDMAEPEFPDNLYVEALRLASD